MIDNLEQNGKIMPLTLKQFGELQQEIIKTEQSARQFNQTSQDLQKGLTGLATSFAPKTTFMNIQQLVDTNRKSLTDARNILRDDLSILGRETLKDENFLVSDAQFEQFVKNPGEILGKIASFLEVEDSFDRNIFDNTMAHTGRYKNQIPDWRDTFSKEAIEVLKELKYI